GNALCDPACGGNPCNPGCRALGLGTGPCDDACPDEFRCNTLLCPLTSLCDPSCGGTDFNANGFADRCDITLCRATPPVAGGCDDCNLNFIPDQCDIDSGTSLDVNLNGIPDECCIWTGSFLGGLFSELLCLDNVTIDPNAVPATSAAATSAQQTVVTVDAAASVNSLRLLNGAVLAVTGSVDENLTVLAGGITISGRRNDPAGASRMLVANDRVVDASPGLVLIDAGGEYVKDPAATAASSASLLAGQLTINAGSAASLRSGGRLELTDTMSATIGGDLLLDGAAPDLADEVAAGSATSLAARGGQTPPIMRGRALTGVASTSAAGGVTGVQRVTIGGDFQMLKEADVCMGCDFTPGAQPPIVSLAGDFDNQSSAPDLFDWRNGILRLSGTAVNTASGAAAQVFEVAGVDMGATPDGLNVNFAMGTVDVAATAAVTFVNNVANTAGLGAGIEALYVDRLVLAAGSTVTLDNVRIYFTRLEDNGATINLLGVGQLVSLCAAAAPLADVIEAKNRYLSFTAGDAGRSQAIRITAVNIPPPNSSLNGFTAWVGTPQLVSENGGSIAPVAGFANFNAATLSCAPAFSDWTATGTVHVWHRAIIPGGRYAIQVLNDICDTSIEADFSPALNLTQSVWGDLTGAFDSVSNTWAAPDGVVAVISDVIAIVDKFAGRGTAPIKTRVDIEPATPDQLINISDATRALDAFRGRPYPFDPGPPPCP
ncbi:MAG: hypothetical protein ACE5EX_07220, partial [Phycisphaerae bacterium]